MADSQKNWHASNFRIEIDGIPAGGFKSVDGLATETEVVEARPGRTKWGNITLKKGYIEMEDLDHKILPAGHKVLPGSSMLKANPGMLKASPSMLKANPATAFTMQTGKQLVLHGFVVDGRNKELLRHWVDPGAPRKATPRGQIVALDLSGREVGRYNFYEAWPCKWYVPELDSDSGATVEIVVGKLIKA